MNNYYVTSQRIAERQSALTANLTHRTQLKEARARKALATVASQPARTRLFLRRLTPATI